MIESFRHKGLKRLYEQGDTSKVSQNMLNRIENVLARLDVANVPQALNLPGYHLHRLTGDFKDFWSVRVSGNYRIIFRFKEGAVFDVDLIDYH